MHESQTVDPVSLRNSVDVTGFHEFNARRVRMTISCKDADLLPKVDGAGSIIIRDNVRLQIMHNGVAIVEGCYYGPWMTEVIRCLRGHHEPQEELAFATILDRLSKSIEPEKLPVMVEFGSFWAYYSLWFLEEFPDGRVICIEPDPEYLEVGRSNFALNKREGTFIQAAVGNHPGVDLDFIAESTGDKIRVPQLDLMSLMQSQNLSHVDIVFADIQGAEISLLESLGETLINRSIRFIVISTHDLEISGSAVTHQKVIELLQQVGAHIIVEHSVSESFSGDGLVVASFNQADRDLEINISYNRSRESLFGEWEPRFEVTRKEMEAKLTNSEQMLASIKEQYDAIVNSKSWKYTYPIRRLVSRAKILMGER